MEWNVFLHTVKRKWEISEEELEDEWMKRRRVEGVDMTGMFSAIAAAAVLEEKGRKKRGKNIVRDKSWWTDGIRNWSDPNSKKGCESTERPSTTSLIEYHLNYVKLQLISIKTQLSPIAN